MASGFRRKACLSNSDAAYLGKELETAVKIVTLCPAEVSGQTFLTACFAMISGSVGKARTYIDIAATWV